MDLDSLINFPGSTEEYNAEINGGEDLRNIQRILMTDEETSANNQQPNTNFESLINCPEGTEEYNAENDVGVDLRSMQRILMADEEASVNNQPPNTNLVTRTFGESTNQETIQQEVVNNSDFYCKVDSNGRIETKL